jgi:hypothetical protein
VVSLRVPDDAPRPQDFDGLAAIQARAGDTLQQTVRGEVGRQGDTEEHDFHNRNYHYIEKNIGWLTEEALNVPYESFLVFR